MDLIGDELFIEVVYEYKLFIVLDYGEVRDIMYGIIYNVDNNVSCVYFGYMFYLLFSVDFFMYLYMNGVFDGINVEYIYLRSKGVDEENGNVFFDMYYFFLVWVVVNIVRSNLFFGEIEDN